jgi:tRNA (guanosine-2'-O-)-methyltransferase
VLEDIYQPHNASAVLRTCDCFGIQDVHIIENNNEYQVNPDVALGSAQWLNLYHYRDQQNNTTTAIRQLRKQGYRIIATTPHSNDTTLEKLDLSPGKCALCFGTELNGLSKKLLDLADECLQIPMFGFTESFNISVSAAIILHHLRLRLHDTGIAWQLSEKEKQQLRLEWLKTTINKSSLLIDEFLRKNS